MAIKKTLGIVLLLFLLGTLLANASSVQAKVGNNSQMLVGSYEGWIYISAEATYDYNNNVADPSYIGKGKMDYDLHGTMFCNIVDSTGVGTCIISIPMTVEWAANAVVNGSDCHATINETARTLPTPYVFSTDTINWTQPFSLEFAPKPNMVKGHANSQVSGNCGESKSVKFRFMAKQPQWPNIDSRRLGMGLSNAVSGKCSMQGLPRSMTINSGQGSTMTAELKLDYCGWGLEYMDPERDLDKAFPQIESE